MMRGVFLVFALASTVQAATAPPLANPGFDEKPGLTGGVRGWSSRGDRYAKARLVTDPVVSAPQAVELSPIGPGSSGNNSFMLFQTLPHELYRGKKLRFGARVRTEGAGINLVLYTPEGMANDFDPEVQSDGFRARSGVLNVPKNASMLSFGIQVFGKRGGRAIVDDAFVRLDDEPEGGAPPAAGGAVSSAASAAAAGAAVRIEVDSARVEREIEPWLFGMHIEWVENAQGILDPARDGLREAVLEKLRPLQIPLFRFPGGIHADYYDWRLGTGPVNERDPAENVFTGKREPNRFGTPELASLLEATGASALMTANFGTGTPELAGGWAREMADERVRAPFWEVGNEIYLSGPRAKGPNGRRIFKSGDVYARDFASYRAAIRKALPQAKVGAIAHIDSGAFPLAPDDNRDWSERMLSALRSQADFISVHDAYAPVILDEANDFRSEEKRRRAYASLYASAEQTRENLDEMAELVDRLSRVNRGVPIAVTEFGPLFGISNKPGPHAVYVDQSRTMAAAVYVASLLDVFIGHPRVMAACYTNPIHRWYGSLLTDTEKGIVLTPTYHLYALYRSRFDRKLLVTRVTSPRFDAERLGLVKARRDVPAVVAKASRSDDGKRVSLMVVNRSVDKEHSAEISVAGFALGKVDCRVLSAASPAAANGPRLTDTTVAGDVAPRALDCAKADRITLRLPPNAVTSVVIERK